MSVPEIRGVRLEIVRPGPPHNQLLSPLTPYLALCGEGSPITFHIEFEHHQLLTRLERLRYVTQSNGRAAFVPDRLREAEVVDLGAKVADILRDIETLSTELGRAQGDEKPETADAIVHLRLVFSGSELAMIPFEIASAPLGYPGEGMEFCLQASLPIVITREIRRGRPLCSKWNRGTRQAPKMLIAWAEPNGMRVPAQEHVAAIRKAFEPWIRRLAWNDRDGSPEDRAAKRLDYVKNRIRLLPNATVDSLNAICAKENFTHVHLLAHGDVYEYAGERRFGVALCSSDGTGQKEVVSGKRLAKALQAEDDGGCRRSDPLVVTLATCDSANGSSVIAPGGSIAHDLHSEGIPWVFASQFPLTVAGSVRMAEGLYPRLLRGDDPRQILFELRRQLYRSTRGDHDWASIVTYACAPPDFDSQVSDFAARQMKEAIKCVLDYADSFPPSATVAEDPAALEKEVARVTTEVEALLHLWRCHLPKGNKPEERARRTDASGMHGSTYKRLALLQKQIGDSAGEQRFYRKSLKFYQDTMTEAAAANQRYYWSATQYLSLSAVDRTSVDAEAFELAERLAKRDLNSPDLGVRTWAHATLAELALLRPYHVGRSSTDELAKIIAEHCQRVVGASGAHSFYVGSTIRQFRRYASEWKTPDSYDWRPLAEAAIAVLVPPDGEEWFDYPED